MSRKVCLTIDVERDCPPFLHSYRGIESGLPALLDLLARYEVKATFFVTGNVGRRYPQRVKEIVAQHHELGSHGESHTDFRRLPAAEAAAEIKSSVQYLRQFAPVASFRAPYLQFPHHYLPFLVEQGVTIDSSQALYKPPYHREKDSRHSSLQRIPASMTSSLLRLPTPLLRPLLNRLSSPAVLFVHPWEFVDLRHEKIRFDCRWRTGTIALNQLQIAIEHLQRSDTTFVTINQLRMDTVAID